MIVADLVEYVDGAECVVGPEADAKQEEDKKRLFGTSLISACIRKVWLVP